MAHTSDLDKHIHGGQITATRVLPGQPHHTSPAPNVKPPTLNLSVQPIDNGFIARVQLGAYVEPKEIFIATLEELPDVLTAQIAANKIGV